MPNVVGLSPADAVRVIEEAGLQVEIQHEGNIVHSQFPAPDTELSKNSIVMIDLQ